MPETPEQRARREIDADLTAAGWLVQDLKDLDLTAGRGIAVREFKMSPGFGFADYMLSLEPGPQRHRQDIAFVGGAQTRRCEVFLHASTSCLLCPLTGIDF